MVPSSKRNHLRHDSYHSQFTYRSFIGHVDSVSRVCVWSLIDKIEFLTECRVRGKPTEYLINPIMNSVFHSFFPRFIILTFCVCRPVLHLRIVPNIDTQHTHTNTSKIWIRIKYLCTRCTCEPSFNPIDTDCRTCTFFGHLTNRAHYKNRNYCERFFSIYP